MKLPSLRLAFQDARDTFARFPVIIADGIVGTTAALILVDYEGPPQPTVLFRVLFAAALGLPLLLSLALHSERKEHGRWTAFGLQCAGILLLIAYSFTVPLEFTQAPNFITLRFLLLGVSLVLLAMVVPSSGGGTENGFWQFNRHILVRVVTTGLYAVVLFAGFALAMAALDNLFSVSVPPRRYGELWVVILGLFCPWFFLAGVPGHRALLDAGADYPKGLKAFALYILTPIVLVYLVILYAYLAKVLIAWDWPKGWVSGLIFGFSSSAIVLTLLLKPLAEREGMTWIIRAINWFYVVLSPLLIMLFLALWRRVSEYGITEPRYLGIALVAWMTILVLYNLFSRKPGLRFIPLSLCIGALLVSFGPWGAFAVSEASQIARFEHMITTTGIAKEGKISKVHPDVPFEYSKQISGVVDYLRENHGFDGIQRWFTEDLRADSSTTGSQFKPTRAVVELMGLSYVEPWVGSDQENLTLKVTGGFDLSGYDRMKQLPEYGRSVDLSDSLGDGISYEMTDGINEIVFTTSGSKEELLRLDLRQHADSLIRNFAPSSSGHLAESTMAMRAARNGLSVRVCPWLITTSRRDGKTSIVRLDAVLLYSVRKPG